MLFLLLVLLIFATEKMQSPRSHITEELRDHGWTSLEEGKLVLRQGRWIAGDKARGTMFAFDKFSLLLCLLGGIHQVLGDGKPEELEVPSWRHERWSQKLFALSVALQEVVILILQLSGRPN